MTQHLLCLRCRATIDVQPEHSLYACPECGGTGVPADLGSTVTVTLTTHELRVLTMWASNWARHIADKPGCADSPLVIQGIVDALGTQTDTALTLSQEMSDLRATYPNSAVTVYRNGQPTSE